jgi:hypothetical protein
MRPEPAYSYVRDLLERLTGVRPVPDHEGDLPIFWQGAGFWVRIVGNPDAWVQVFSIALADLEPTPDLMVRLNDINADLRFARAFHCGRQVLIETEIWADDINPANLRHACWNVATATDEHSQALLKEFGGKPYFEDSKTEAYESAKLSALQAMGFTV